MIKDQVEIALKSVEDYLFNSQRYGFWIDFTACHDGSSCWTTSYVGRLLAENPENLKKLSFVADRIRFNQRRDGGWAYNHTAVSDADTTANCLLFLSQFPGAEESIKEGIKYLLNHQNRIVGGFSTYTVEEFKEYAGEDNGKGWCSPSVEVTSLAVKALIKNGYNGNETQQALEFIVSKQNDDGSWQPYWWSSAEYGTVEAISVLAEHPEYSKRVEKALGWLTDKRRSIGWINDFTKKYSPFYAALILSSLLKNKYQLIDKYKLAERYQVAKKFVPELLEIEIRTLLETQNQDGSFGSEPLMRIPRPDIIDISAIGDWNIDSPHKNSIYTDNNRFFTTAAVYSTLLRYLKNGEK